MIAAERASVARSPIRKRTSASHAGSSAAAIPPEAVGTDGGKQQAGRERGEGKHEEPGCRAARGVEGVVRPRRDDLDCECVDDAGRQIHERRCGEARRRQLPRQRGEHCRFDAPNDRERAARDEERHGDPAQEEGFGGDRPGEIEPARPDRESDDREREREREQRQPGVNLPREEGWRRPERDTASDERESGGRAVEPTLSEGLPGDRRRQQHE
jgi:hypothetical protein